MRIAIGLKEIVVYVEYESIAFKIIRQYVDKNFTNRLNLTNAIVIFNSEKESFKRDFFLQWLYASYKKENPELMPSFKDNLIRRKHLPIKIKITDKKEVVSSFKLEIKPFKENIVAMKINIKNYLLQNYLRISFRKEYIEKSADGHSIFLKIDSSDTKEKLQKLIKRKKVLNYPISFGYDEVWMKGFLSSNDSFVEASEDSFVLKAYEILKSTQEDTMDVIKKRYIELAKKVHPDRFFYDDSKLKEYTEQFQLVQRAFETIKEEREYFGYRTCQDSYSK